MKKKTVQKYFKEQPAFESYLMKHFNSDYVVQQHVNNVRFFDTWLKENKLGNIIRITTSIILSYIQFIETAKIMTGTINNRLNSFRKYYDCMIKLGHIKRNPASNIYVGKQEKKVVADPLSADTLHELYQKFEQYMDTKPIPPNMVLENIRFSHLRFKVIASLLIYQGLDAGELDSLHVSDIDISKNTIYISPKKRRRSRVLNLEASQMIPISNYLQQLPSTQTKLFSIITSNSVYYLLKFLRGVEPRVINAGHIRKSRIIIWASTLKLRDAQQKVGHKFATSTEGYAEQNTTELVDAINRIHVFR